MMEPKLACRLELAIFVLVTEPELMLSVGALQIRRRATLHAIYLIAAGKRAELALISPPARYIFIGQLMLPSGSTSGCAGEVWQSSIRIAFPVAEVRSTIGHKTR